MQGGEFSSDLLREFCRGEGILQSFTLPASPQQNGIAERRIGLVMEVARTSMIHAAAPHFLWPFVVRYAAHQLNLWPRVSLPETSPTLHWTGKVGNASVFRVWRYFYRPTSRHVFPSQDVPFDESVPFYHLFPKRSAPPPPLPLFLTPGPPPVDSLPPKGRASSGVSQVDPLSRTVPVESGGAELGGAEPAGVEPGGAEPEGLEPWGAESGGAEPWGAAAAGPGGARTKVTRAAGTGSVGGAGAGGTSAGGAGAGGAGAVDPGAGGAGTGATGAGGTGAGGARAIDPRAGGAGAGGAVSGGTGARGTVRPRPYFVPLLQKVLGLSSSPVLTPPLMCPPPDQLQPPLQPASALRGPSPYTEQTGGLKERCEPESRPTSPTSAIRTSRRVPRPRPPPVPAPKLCHFSDLACAASSTVSCLATVVTDPSFESTAASALVAQLIDFAATCRLDYATALVVESESASPPPVGGECALRTDVLEDRQDDFECLAAAVPRFASMLPELEGDPDAPDIPTPRSYPDAITSPYSSQWKTTMDAKIASWKSTGTYVDAVPLSGANIVDGMWIFRVKPPPSSLLAFKARYVARGFSQRQGGRQLRDLLPHPEDDYSSDVAARCILA
ncbi:unnamed protein product [Closterium sp. NIES-53]